MVLRQFKIDNFDYRERDIGAPIYYVRTGRERGFLAKQTKLVKLLRKIA